MNQVKKLTRRLNYAATSHKRKVTLVTDLVTEEGFHWCLIPQVEIIPGNPGYNSIQKEECSTRNAQTYGRHAIKTTLGKLWQTVTLITIN